MTNRLEQALATTLANLEGSKPVQDKGPRSSPVAGIPLHLYAGGGMGDVLEKALLVSLKRLHEVSPCPTSEAPSPSKD